MIYQPEYIKKILNEQKLEVLVISYGGSCSEALQRALTNSNINSIIPLHAEGHVEWEHAVHLPFYYKMNIPIIYVYDDIRKAFLSQKNRGKGWYDINQQKLANSKHQVSDDSTFLKLMNRQFNSFTNKYRPDVLILKSSDLFLHSVQMKISRFLGKKITTLPMKWIPPKTKNDDFEKPENKVLFSKHQEIIDNINNFKCDWRYRVKSKPKPKRYLPMNIM